MKFSLPSTPVFQVALASVAMLAVAALVWTTFLRESGEDQREAEAGPPAEEVGAAWTSRSIGRPAEGQPWITDLTIGDLDSDGLLDVVVAEARPSRVAWIRQSAPGVYEESDLGEPVAGPAHVEIVDLDQDGDNDVLVAGMGIVTPNDQDIGTVVVLENLGAEGFRNRVLLEGVARVTYVHAADFDADGDLDLSVGQFGYFEGEIRWMENDGDWTFTSHRLLDLAGTIHAPPADLDGDGDLDIVALVSQDWEEVYLFENDGTGAFEPRVLYGSLNKDFGSSGLTVADLDKDGDADIVFTNGDAFDYATPGARPWHGAQWLENCGDRRFEYHRIGDLSGAYSPVVVDLDNDGDRDVVSVSGFNDWSREGAVSLMCFVNDGDQRFTPRVVAYQPTHLVVIDAADMDGDGQVELVSGGFHFYPPYDEVSRVSLWERKR